MEKISFTIDLKEKVTSGLKKIVSGFAKVADTVDDLHKHLPKTNEEVENRNSKKNKCASIAYALEYLLIVVIRRS